MTNINEEQLEVKGKLSSKKYWLTLVFSGATIFLVALGIYVYMNIKHPNSITKEEPTNYYKSSTSSNDDSDIKMIRDASEKARASQEASAIAQKLPQVASNGAMVPPIGGANGTPPIIANNQAFNVNNMGQSNTATPMNSIEQKKQQEADQRQQDYYNALKSSNGMLKLTAIALSNKASSSAPTSSGSAGSGTSLSELIASKSNSSETKGSGAQNGIAVRKKARSPYALKAGTNIPLTLTKGLNSDKPGNVTGLVRSDVFDSATHKLLLIPQGSTMFGKYDNQLSFGDTRIAVAWTKLYYPDGTYVDLQAVPGTDMQGFSGFSGQVDNHYWSLFGTSFIMGVITGAMQYSQNNTNPNVQVGGIGVSTNPSVGQTISGSMGQQLGQTGMAVVNKGLNVQPTITIRDGSKVNAELAAELVLPPPGR